MRSGAIPICFSPMRIAACGVTSVSWAGLCSAMRGSMLIERISRGRMAGHGATWRGVLVAVGFALGTGAMGALPAAPAAPQAAPSGLAGLSQKAETPTHADSGTQADATANPHTDPN